MIPFAQAADAVRMGAIQGGWEYVNAAYAITWSSLALYAFYLEYTARHLTQESSNELK